MRFFQILHVYNVTKPLIVFQGANDARVLQVESDEIVDEVKANGTPLEYVIFDDEGMGLERRKMKSRDMAKSKNFRINT